MGELSTTQQGEAIRDVQLKKSNLIYETSVLEEELHNLDLYKQIETNKKLIEAYNNEEEAMKESILNGMIANGLKSLEFTNQKFTVKSNPPSVKIIDEEVIPNEFKQEVKTIKIDKVKIKDYLKNGGIVDGAELTVGHSLVITPK